VKAVREKSLALSTIDLLFKAVETRERSSDFALVFHLKRSPDIESLRLGALSARNLFPTTGSYLNGKVWSRCEHSEEGIELVSRNETETVATVEESLSRQMDLRHQLPVQQLAIMICGKVILVTRFHHVAADGFSAALWLQHQLSVARGLLAPVLSARPYQQAILRRHSAPVRQSKFAFGKPSSGLWTTKASVGLVRRWSTFDIAVADLRKLTRAKGLSYNDLLATCALEVFAEWNQKKEHDQRIGLWLPVNIRQKGSSRFGNGTSRIRLFRRYSSNDSIVEKCLEVRRQIRWSLKHGEWSVPDRPFFTRLPLSIGGPILRTYLNRPGVDMATGVFTHVEKWSNAEDHAFDDLDRIESVGQLHKQHALSINAVTLRERTWFTFTYNAARLSSTDVQRLIDMYQVQIELARKEIA
jgi:hypothetical protein